MTVLECEKCGQAGANDFTQLGPVYRDGQPVQRFQCNKCGHVKEIPAIASGIALTSLRGTHPIISMADFNCLNCGYGCYIPWNYCPKCGKKLARASEVCKTCPEKTKKHCLTPGDPGPACTEGISNLGGQFAPLNRAREGSSRDLWSGIRVWYPPGDPKGAYYRTEYVGKTEKDADITVHMKLIPEEEWKKTHAQQSHDSSENTE